MCTNTLCTRHKVNTVLNTSIQCVLYSTKLTSLKRVFYMNTKQNSNVNNKFKNTTRLLRTRKLITSAVSYRITRLFLKV